jgi:ParB/RepB/Spo0J family partition protein
MADVRVINVADIRKNTVALRGVDVESEKFQELVDSIKSKGIINPIAVRAKQDPTNGENYYEVMDGLHRFTASVEAGLTEIPANILNVSESENLDIQISANFHRVDTKPSEYTKALLQMLASNPTMTEEELAGRLNVSRSFIDQRLSLAKLHDEIKTLVDDSKIALANAFVMTKLDREEQPLWVERAMTMGTAEFCSACQARIKEVNDAKRKGQDPKKLEFAPHAYAQKMSAIKAEQENLNEIKSLITNGGITDPCQAATMAISWVLHLDPVSVNQAKTKWDEQQKAKEELKKKREEEREAKKAAEAKTTSASIEDALGIK